MDHRLFCVVVTVRQRGSDVLHLWVSGILVSNCIDDENEETTKLQMSLESSSPLSKKVAWTTDYARGEIGRGSWECVQRSVFGFCLETHGSWNWRPWQHWLDRIMEIVLSSGSLSGATTGRVCSRPSQKLYDEWVEFLGTEIILRSRSTYFCSWLMKIFRNWSNDDETSLIYKPPRWNSFATFRCCYSDHFHNLLCNSNINFRRVWWC